MTATQPDDQQPRGNSRPVLSRQNGPHPSLESRVLRYRDSAFSKPIAEFNRQAFAQAADLLREHAGPLILDSGCGVGDSTRALAQRYPDHLILGLDRSEDRLTRQRRAPLSGNAHLIRTDLIDFWRLADEAGWRPTHHFLLYPNPCPKPDQLQRRFHAHPVFPHLVRLGGILECRSNWLIYLQELASALALYGINSQIIPLPEGPAMTPFEQKYRNSGQQLWQLISESPPDPDAAQ